MMMQRLCVAICAFCSLSYATERNKYLIISSPSLHKVVYTKIPDGVEQVAAEDPLPLIDSGLKTPQGIAVDHKRNLLFVADPDLKKVLCYKLVFRGGQLLTDGEPTTAASGSESRWVAVDGNGNVFVSDEASNSILKVPGENLRGGNPTPHVIYGSENPHVSAPGGVAVDNFHVYWTNKAAGSEVGVGSVVRGFETPTGTDATGGATELARNAPKVYGVCLSENNVFYTDATKAVYGVKKTASAIATISDKFIEPRGCAWDLDGTIYVADKGANAVSSFAGNMRNLAPAPLSFTVKYDGAFGVAVLAGAPGLSSCMGLLTVLVALAFGQN